MTQIMKNNSLFGRNAQLSSNTPSSQKECRSQGVSHKFMNDIILFAKENSVEYIRIDTHKDNVIMRKYLSKNNFKELDEIKLSMKNSLDDKKE